MNRKKSLAFILLIGVVSLFSDMVYEGARSIAGPFLETLHANAFVVGFFAGLGELIGYGFRLVSGYFADRTRRYWAFIFIGYSLNLFSVPLLALAGYWQLAVIFMMMERLGKAIRTPSRDAMLAHATTETGRGWGFGLHEALDQIGATLGPLMVMLAMYLSSDSYAMAYAWMIVPALMAISVLVFARSQFPAPEQLRMRNEDLRKQGFTKYYWIYIIIASLVAFGFADFPIIAYHLKSKQVITELWIPGLYAIAMLSDAFAALVFGRLFDRHGTIILALAIGLGLFYAPLAFLGNAPMVIAGAVLWGIGLGAQESIMKAMIANAAPTGRVASAFGIFHTLYGVAWFLGSALMGFVYQPYFLLIVIIPIAAQLSAVILLLIHHGKGRRKWAGSDAEQSVLHKD